MNNDRVQSGPGTTGARVGDLPSSTAPAGAEADQTPNEITSRAREIAHGGLEQAKRLSSATRERVFRTADERKGQLSDKLDELARNIDELGEKAGAQGELPRKLVGGASRALRSVQHTLDNRSTEELIDEVGRQIRRRPGMFLASCLAVGFIGARLLRK
jgi:hypothetical protein